MDYLRRAAVVFLAGILPLLLFGLAFNVAVTGEVGSPAPIKKTLVSSGIYNNLISNLLSNAQKNVSGGASVPLTDPAIKNAAEQAFSPQLIQRSSEQIIDGFYEWLDGKTAQPNFRIDLTGAKDSFANLVAQAYTAKAAALPKCTYQQLAQAQSYASDPTSLTCLPPTITPAQVGADAKNIILSGQGFMDNPVITSNDVKTSSSSSPISSRSSSLPGRFQALKKAPYALSVLALADIAGIIYLSRSWTAGLRRAGIIVLGVGIASLLIAYILNLVFSDNVLSKINISNNVFDSDVKAIAKSIFQAIDKTYWIIGGAYTALGAGALAGGIYYGRQHAQEPEKAKSRS